MMSPEHATAACENDDSRFGPDSRLNRVRTTKIQPRHLSLSAIVYVRQSTLIQVQEHVESKARQYDLARHAVDLGWAKSQVVIIDEDQGKSGREAAHRTGFQRLLTEVTLGHVGLVLGLEMSRLARSSKDWHHLLELCALFGTLLGDQDGIYNPTDSNDRLLLGLKGTMSEFELLTMRNRLQRGLLNKAERGELHIAPPIGFERLPSGEIVLDRDEQVRSVIELIFDKFEELGTARKVLIYLVKNQILLGYRWNRGSRMGELEWRTPSYGTVLRILTHPNYAGAYVFGRKDRDGGTQTRDSAWGKQNRYRASSWKILLKDHFPAYISWSRYEVNQQRIELNTTRDRSSGAPRKGSALLSGLAICGGCGRRLQPYYPRGASYPHYLCRRHVELIQEPTCRGTAARVIDELVVKQLHEVLQPASLKLSLRAIEDSQAERKRLHGQWQKKRERARYEMQRAERQYQAVEPENRLVARTLEARWEAALLEQRRIEDEYDRFASETPLQLTDAERSRITELSKDVPALWNAQTTTNEDRKEIIRCLVDQVVICVQENTEYCDVTIHWKGGYTSQHEVIRPVQRRRQLRDADKLQGRITELKQQGLTAAQIADVLNEEGFVPARQRGEYTVSLVAGMLRQYELVHPRIREQLSKSEWWLTELATRLDIPTRKLRDWALRGWCHARKSSSSGEWIIWANRPELNRLRRLIQFTRPGKTGYPQKLTTPVKRNG